MSRGSHADIAADMVAVDRAAGELRRNGAVIIDDDRGAALAQAAETATAGDIAALARVSNGSVSLALTAHRASVLGLVGAGPGIVTLPVADGIDAAAAPSAMMPSCR